MEAHLPVRLLTEMDLEDADLQGVRVLVLPDAACLSDRAAEVVRRFVHAGGGLVASHETSLYGEDYQRRKDFALGDLFRAHYVGSIPVARRTDALQLTLQKDHPIVDDALIRSRETTAWRDPNGPPPDRGPLALIASASEVEALEGGAVRATFTMNDPKRAGKQYPALVTSNYGKGRVAYFASGVDKAMFFYPDGALRADLPQRLPLGGGRRAAARAGAGAPDPGHDLPPSAEGRADRGPPAQPRQFVGPAFDLPEARTAAGGAAQGACYPDSPELSGTWPIREEVIPLHDIRVTCRVPGVTKATLQPGGLDLPMRRLDDGVEVQVPKVEMHADGRL